MEKEPIVVEFRFGKVIASAEVDRDKFESVPLKSQLDIIEDTFERMRDSVRVTVHETAKKIIV